MSDAKVAPAPAPTTEAKKEEKEETKASGPAQPTSTAEGKGEAKKEEKKDEKEHKQGWMATPVPIIVITFGQEEKKQNNAINVNFGSNDQERQQIPSLLKMLLDILNSVLQSMMKESNGVNNTGIQAFIIAPNGTGINAVGTHGKPNEQQVAAVTNQATEPVQSAVAAQKKENQETQVAPPPRLGGDKKE